MNLTNIRKITLVGDLHLGIRNNSVEWMNIQRDFLLDFLLTKVDEDFDDVVDVVIFWFRSGDDDLVEALMDAIHPLTDHGVIWLFTPKPGRVGHVEPEEIAESAPSAGLQVTSTISASQLWQGTRLVAPRSRR